MYISLWENSRGHPDNVSFMQFSTKIDGFEQEDSQGFENSYNSYEQYPSEKFFHFHHLPKLYFGFNGINNFTRFKLMHWCCDREWQCMLYTMSQTTVRHWYKIRLSKWLWGLITSIVALWSPFISCIIISSNFHYRRMKIVSSRIICVKNWSHACIEGDTEAHPRPPKESTSTLLNYKGKNYPFI